MSFQSERLSPEIRARINEALALEDLPPLSGKESATFRPELPVVTAGYQARCQSHPAAYATTEYCSNRVVRQVTIPWGRVTYWRTDHDGWVPEVCVYVDLLDRFQAEIWKK